MNKLNDLLDAAEARLSRNPHPSEAANVFHLLQNIVFPWSTGSSVTARYDDLVAKCENMME
jgi:hypothetical protein